MSVPADLDDVLGRLYGALQSGDLDTWAALHSEDVAFNINGQTVMSGRITGKDVVMSELLPLLFTRIKPEASSFGVDWKCMCANGKRAAVIFEGRSETLEGKPYNNRYLQLLEFDDGGLICEVWEFFDTALAEALIFTPEQRSPTGLSPFRY
jgi:ketosteroid isomerase-like protein